MFYKTALRQEILKRSNPQAEKLFLACFCFLCTVKRTALVSLGNALSIQCSSDDVVTYTGKVSYTTASDKNNRVLLQVVADTRDVTSSLKTVYELNSGDLSDSGVRLLRCSCGYLCTYTSLLRRALVGGTLLYRVVAFLENRGFRLITLVLTTVFNELVKGWHCGTSFLKNSFIYINAPWYKVGQARERAVRLYRLRAVSIIVNCVLEIAIRKY